MLEPGDIVLCTVERIERTIVFVKVSWHGEEKEGSIVTSEIAPGRIRNIRDYVVPKKRIICKVLRISASGNVELSLRRVTPKERKEILEQIKQEKSYKSILKSVLGEDIDKVIEDILKEDNLYDFLQEAKENSKKLEKIVGKDYSKKILEILGSQKQKKSIIKKEMYLKSSLPNGLKLIKDILGDIKEAEIKYISAGKYSLKTESEDIKKADTKAREILSEIEKKAKEKKMEFSIREK